MDEKLASTSPQWAVDSIHTCVGVQPEEKVLIVVDEPLGYVRDALLVGAAHARPVELLSYGVTPSPRRLARWTSSFSSPTRWIGRQSFRHGLLGAPGWPTRESCA